MSRVGLGAAWRQGSEQGLEAEFEIAHGHDAVDGALAELGGQGEDFGGDPAQVAVLLFQAVLTRGAYVRSPAQCGGLLRAISACKMELAGMVGP